MDSRWQGLIGCAVTVGLATVKGRIIHIREDGKEVVLDFDMVEGPVRYNPYSVFVMVKGREYRLEHLMDILEMFSYGPPETTEGEI